MKILFFTLVPNEDLYMSLADEFKNNHHFVTFVTPTEGQTHFDYLNEHSILYFHAGKMLNVGLIRKGINNMCFSTFCVKAIMKYINPEDYQLILMSTPPLGYLSSIKFVKRKNPNIKFYLLLRDIHPEGSTHLLKKIPYLYNYFKCMAESLYNLSDIIGCMTPYNVSLIQNTYLKYNPDKVKLLPNWGSKIEFHKPSDEIKIKHGIKDKFVVIYGGNMGKFQNLTLFLKLAKEKQIYKDVLFLFIGNGTEREKLRKIVKKEKILNVRIENTIPYNDYNELLKCASLGIITLHPMSFFANSPSKTISYWQFKIPILASLDKLTDYGNFLIDRSRSGLWSLATDYDALSANFDKLYHNPQMRKEMGENGYTFFYNNYTVDKTYIEIMKQLKF